MAKWNNIIDFFGSEPEGYVRLVSVLRNEGKFVFSLGPCLMYGIEYEIYRFQSKLYMIYWDMFGHRGIDIL